MTERITMVTSFCPRSSFIKDDSGPTTVRPVSILGDLYHQFAGYRFEVLQDRFRDANRFMRDQKGVRRQFDTAPCCYRVDVSVKKATNIWPALGNMALKSSWWDDQWFWTVQFWFPFFADLFWGAGLRVMIWRFPHPLHKKLKLSMDMLVLTKEDTKKYRQSGQSLE